MASPQPPNGFLSTEASAVEEAAVTTPMLNKVGFFNFFKNQSKISLYVKIARMTNLDKNLQFFGQFYYQNFGELFDYKGFKCKHVYLPYADFGFLFEKTHPNVECQAQRIFQCNQS